MSTNFDFGSFEADGAVYKLVVASLQSWLSLVITCEFSIILASIEWALTVRLAWFLGSSRARRVF